MSCGRLEQAARYGAQGGARGAARQPRPSRNHTAAAPMTKARTTRIRVGEPLFLLLAGERSPTSFSASTTSWRVLGLGPSLRALARDNVSASLISRAAVESSPVFLRGVDFPSLS